MAGPVGNGPGHSLPEKASSNLRSQSSVCSLPTRLVSWPFWPRSILVTRALPPWPGSGRNLLPGLGEGRTYQLSAKPYGIRVWSDDLLSGGSYEFKVGSLEVSLLDEEGVPLPATEVGVGVPASDGSFEWVLFGRTDGTGRVRLDPPVSKRTELVLGAKRPSDGRFLVSRPVAIPGSHQFRVVPETLTSLLTRSGSTPLGSQGSN